jgi:hypothetical protein
LIDVFDHFWAIIGFVLGGRVTLGGHSFKWWGFDAML